MDRQPLLFVAFHVGFEAPEATVTQLEDNGKEINRLCCFYMSVIKENVHKTMDQT